MFRSRLAAISAAPVWALLAAACATTPTAPAPERTTDPDLADAEEAALVYMDSIRNHDVETMTACMHPEALAQFQTTLRAVIKMASQQGADTSDSSELLKLFAGVDSLEQLQQLDERAFFAAFYSGLTASTPQLQEMLAQTTIRPIGAVRDTDGTVYVVYEQRMGAAAQGSQKTAVLGLKRHEQSWKILLTGDMNSYLAALGQALTR